MTFLKARSVLSIFTAMSLLVSASALADGAKKAPSQNEEEKKELTPECAKARKAIDLIWDKFNKCLNEKEEAEFEGITVDASKCDSIKDQIQAQESAITEPYAACPNVTKATYRNSFFIGPKVGHEMGYTSAGTGGFLMRFTASPMAGFFDTRDHNPEKGMSMEFANVEVGIRYTDNTFALDSISVKIGQFQKYFVEHLGIDLSHNLVYDTNRGQIVNNWDGKIILNLLKTAFTSLYRGTHIVIGAGTRLQLRDFTVIAGTEELVNFHVPVSVDMAFTFLEGKLTFAAFAEAALNPLRIRDHLIKAKVEGRYNVYTDVAERQPSATYVNYRIDLGAKYEVEYQNETAYDYGKPTDPILGDKLIHRALGFMEIAF